MAGAVDVVVCRFPARAHLDFSAADKTVCLIVGSARSSSVKIQLAKHLLDILSKTCLNRIEDVVIIPPQHATLEIMQATARSYAQRVPAQGSVAMYDAPLATIDQRKFAETLKTIRDIAYRALIVLTSRDMDVVGAGGTTLAGAVDYVFVAAGSAVEMTDAQLRAIYDHYCPAQCNVGRFENFVKLLCEVTLSKAGRYIVLDQKRGGIYWYDAEWELYDPKSVCMSNDLAGKLLSVPAQPSPSIAELAADFAATSFLGNKNAEPIDEFVTV
jgi:hypothetical protein